MGRAREAVAAGFKALPARTRRGAGHSCNERPRRRGGEGEGELPGQALSDEDPAGTYGT